MESSRASVSSLVVCESRDVVRMKEREREKKKERRKSEEERKKYEIGQPGR